jgi:hypothetical protein
VDPVGVDVGKVGDKGCHAVASGVDGDAAGREGADACLLDGLGTHAQAGGASDAVHLGGVVRPTAAGQSVLHPGADLGDHLLGVLLVEADDVVQDQAPSPR